MDNLLIIDNIEEETPKWEKVYMIDVYVGGGQLIKKHEKNILKINIQ